MINFGVHAGSMCLSNVHYSQASQGTELSSLIKCPYGIKSFFGLQNTEFQFYDYNGETEDS